ncbi:MAG: hypothetical protein HUU55_09860 [Myxococcales bacterium]|nr:hypothetical protein [Myxococcales bacterium]
MGNHPQKRRFLAALAAALLVEYREYSARSDVAKAAKSALLGTFQLYGTPSQMRAD